jgi:16S rRNA (cytidine(1402)-2'-O)-methyltransferase
MKAKTTATGAAGQGCLYLVATPVGNMEDITHRALRVLREADLVAAEDTRRSRKLLTHFGIHRPVLSYYREEEKRRSQQLLALLAAGKKIALISDAGTPGISDPGFLLVKAALDIGIPVVPVPGASALLPALVASGLPASRFVFEGFFATGEQGTARPFICLTAGRADYCPLCLPPPVTGGSPGFTGILGRRTADRHCPGTDKGS